MLFQVMVEVCPLCRAYAAKDLKSLLRHIGAVHSHEAGFFVHCGLQDCPRTCNNFHSYKKHLYTKHREALGLVPNSTAEVSEDVLMSTYTDLGASFRSVDQHEDSSEDAIVEQAQVEKRAAALFALKSLHVHKVSQSALSGLMADISTMLEYKVSQIEHKVMGVLKDCDSNIKASVRNHFSSQSVVDPFCGLNTSQKQKTYFSDHFHLLVST